MRRFAALLSCSLAVAAIQATADAAAATQKFEPVADTYVDSSAPKKNFGSATRVYVRGSSDHIDEAYARFEVAGLSGPVASARLRLYVTDGTGNGPAVYRITTSWAEKKVTWKTRPHTLSSPHGDKNSLTAGSWVSWDVTDWVTEGGTYAFALKGGSANKAAFMSREAATAPQLVVTTSPPSSSAVTYVAPSTGSTVSGTTPVKVQVPTGTDWIGVYACLGSSVGEDLAPDANGDFEVAWDTTMGGCSNGSQEVDTWAFKSDGSALGHALETVNVDNAPSLPAATSQCADGVDNDADGAIDYPIDAGCADTSDDNETDTLPGEPSPIAGLGYHVAFDDEFDSLNRGVWCSHQWWEANPPIGTQFIDSNGVLHLQRRKGDGYPNNSLSSEPCGQANPKSFQGGYFEARLRFTGVPGSGPAFWLFSTRHATNPAWPGVNPYCSKNGLPLAQCYSGELDVFEGYGNHLDVFTGTIHRNSCNCYGVSDSQTSNNWQPQATGTSLGSDWHVYAAKWTNSTVSWYLDGRLIMSAPAYDSTPQPMHLIFYNWATPWEAGNSTSSSSPDVIETQVDWVRAWQN